MRENHLLSRRTFRVTALVFFVTVFILLLPMAFFPGSGDAWSQGVNWLWALIMIPAAAGLTGIWLVVKALAQLGLGLCAVPIRSRSSRPPA